jgi:hypothetical protein
MLASLFPPALLTDPLKLKPFNVAAVGTSKNAGFTPLNMMGSPCGLNPDKPEHMVVLIHISLLVFANSAEPASDSDRR